MTDQTDNASDDVGADAEAESKAARAEGVRRMLSGEDAPQETEQPGSKETSEGTPPPDGVGESITRRAEDIAKAGKEPGRYDSGTDGTPADRPTGGSTARDATGVDPQDPVTESPPMGG